MFKKAFYNQPDLLHAIDSVADADQVRQTLHTVFETESLTTVGPRQFESWVQEQSLPESLVVLSKQAEHQAMEQGQ